MNNKSVYTKLLMSLLVMLTITTSFAQKKKIEKANKDFDTYAYIDAREIYLKVVEDGYASAQVFQKLGDTYYFNGEYGDAAKWYERSINEFPGETTPEYYYRAAQSFKSLEQYEASDKYMNAYDVVGGGTLIVRNFNDDPDYLKSIAFQAKGYEVEKVSINSAASDFGPSYYMDKLVYAKASNVSEGTKIHEWNQQPFLDLFVADMDEEGRLSNPKAFASAINTKYHESSSSFTKDGNTVYFTRNNFTNGKKGRDKQKTIRLKLYKASKVSDSVWGNVEELPFNTKDYSVAHPTLSVDEKRLYFASDMPGTLGSSDIWYVKLLDGGLYSAPVNLGPSINTEARETFPFISKENNMYFSTDGRAGLGGLDIFVTPLDEQGEPGVITNLGSPANSILDDFGFIINEEKRIGYLSSNRDGGNEQGSVADDIYRVQEKCEITIAGIITNGATQAPLPGAIVTLIDSEQTTIETVTAGADGTYTFTEVADCGADYIVRAREGDGDGLSWGCEPNEETVTTPLLSGVIQVPVALSCDPCPPNDLGCRLELQPIYFDFDKFNIRPDAEIELAKILAAMRQYPQLIIHIESHTDSRAPDRYNEILSEKRAQSTLGWLVDKGISRSRLTAKGYGEYQLQNHCSNGVECTEEEHQWNRRSMFIIQN